MYAYVVFGVFVDGERDGKQKKTTCMLFKRNALNST